MMPISVVELVLNSAIRDNDCADRRQKFEEEVSQMRWKVKDDDIVFISHLHTTTSLSLASFNVCCPCHTPFAWQQLQYTLTQSVTLRGYSNPSALRLAPN